MSEEKAFSREDFIFKLGSLGGSLFVSPFLKLAFAGAPDPSLTRRDRDTLVVIFLRGGCDGLNLVPPISGEDRAIYEAERPTIKIPISGDKAALRLDERFGLHPSAQTLYPLFQSKKLAVIHAVGLTADTRSHFDAQTYMETGTPDRRSTNSGWIARYLEGRKRLSAGSQYLPEALSVGGLPPTSLLSLADAGVIQQLGGIDLGANKNFHSAQKQALHSMYRKSAKVPDWLATAGADTINLIELLEKTSVPPDAKVLSLDYAKGEIGNRLKTLSQLLKMRLGVGVATVDMGGWDTHKNQEGQFANNVLQLSQSLAAFYADLEIYGLTKNLTVVVMTEFGRRLKENANHGTDHGHGGTMLVLGEHVNGGKVHGRWPGLKSEKLYDRADLAVTTDFRQILAEMLSSRLKVKKLDKIFPDYKSVRPLGVFQA